MKKRYYGHIYDQQTNSYLASVDDLVVSNANGAFADIVETDLGPMIVERGTGAKLGYLRSIGTENGIAAGAFVIAAQKQPSSREGT